MDRRLCAPVRLRRRRTQVEAGWKKKSTSSNGKLMGRTEEGGKSSQLRVRSRRTKKLPPNDFAPNDFAPNDFAPKLIDKSARDLVRSCNLFCIKLEKNLSMLQPNTPLPYDSHDVKRVRDVRKRRRRRAYTAVIESVGRETCPKRV